MGTLELILATVVDEFSDLNDIENATRVTLRLMFAAMLGGILGFEREQQGKAAGIRTHMLVCLGAALFVVSSGQLAFEDDALSRVIQGIIQGIGFLCAGTILKGDSLSSVRGLTTAAGLWFTAAIGVAVGLGNEAIALVSTVLALVVLHVIPLLVRKTESHEP